LGGLPTSNLLRKGIRRETYLDIPSKLFTGKKREGGRWIFVGWDMGRRIGNVGLSTILYFCWMF